MVKLVHFLNLDLTKATILSSLGPMKKAILGVKKMAKAQRAGISPMASNP